MPDVHKILLVGCGRICKKHIEALQELIAVGVPISICGTVDPLEERASHFADLLSCPSFKSVTEAIQSVEFNTAVIMTPSGTHATLGIQLAPYTENLIIEKPIALNLSEVDVLIDTSLRLSTKIYVVKQNRFNPAVKYLKHRLDGGDFGDVSLATVRVRWCRSQEYYDSASWRGTWRLDGGVLANQASHHIDLLQWMFGDVVTVASMTGNPMVKIEAEDTAGVLLKFRSGVLGIIEATTSARPSDIEGSISVLGSKGLVIIGGKAVNRVELDTLPPSNYQDKRSVEASPADVYGFGHKQFYSILFSDNADKSLLVDGLEGRRSIELIQAIYESIESRSFVDLSFRSKYSRLGS